MKFVKILSALSLLLSALIFAGCSTGTQAGGNGHTIVMGGLYESKEAAYEPVGTTTFHTRKSDWFPGTDYDDTKATFLWGLITYTDY